jgi:hypothetical protein
MHKDLHKRLPGSRMLIASWLKYDVTYRAGLTGIAQIIDIDCVIGVEWQDVVFEIYFKLSIITSIPVTAIHLYRETTG